MGADWGARRCEGKVLWKQIGEQRSGVQEGVKARGSGDLKSICTQQCEVLPIFPRLSLPDTQDSMQTKTQSIHSKNGMSEGRLKTA
eukprot:1158890-Pelagomonas_calceolata.AAC.13